VNQRGRQSPRDRGDWLDRVDWVVAVRGASLGFTVLVITGLANLIVVRVSPTAGLVWSIVGPLLAFGAAAWRSGPADSPWLTGLFAAFFGYTLYVPLMYIGTRHIDWPSTLLYAGVAIVVGAAVGHLRGRQRA
jgi:hypothetical protein